MSETPQDPYGFRARLAAHLEWLRVRNYAEGTIQARSRDVGQFVAWAEMRGLRRPGEVTRAILERYQHHLYHYRQSSGKPLSFGVQRQKLSSLRGYYRWLCRQNHIPANPAADLELPRVPRRIPQDVLTASEAEAILAEPDVRDPLGLRDRAILETFYSTGMRRMEICELAETDLDPERGTLLIRRGKGKKDRVVPIGGRALRWVETYRADGRPELAAGATGTYGTLFLTATGQPFTRNAMTDLVRGYVEAADVGKSGACHLFRHTVATLMLENGADVRFIQQLLGHARLSTTQIYTRVAIRALKEVHARTHPAAGAGRAEKRPSEESV